MTTPTPAAFSRPVRERQIVSDVLAKVGRMLLAQDTPSMEDVQTFADLVQAQADLVAARAESAKQYHNAKAAE